MKHNLNFILLIKHYKIDITKLSIPDVGGTHSN